MTNTIVSATRNKLCFSYIASLGCACNTSMYLKQLNLKLFSLPYDWIFSNLDMIQHTIEDDFQSFLNPELINTRKQKQAGHNYYHNRLFNHHNPKDNEDDRSYYQRCISRFKSVLSSEEKKLFIHTVYQNPQKYHRHFMEFGSNFKKSGFELEDADKFNSFLSTVTSNYTFLVIVQNPNQPEAQVRKIFDENNLMVYVVDCLGVSSGQLLTNPIDHENYQKIITQFDYELKPIA